MRAEGPRVSEGGRGGEWQKALAKWGQEWPVGGPTEGPVLSGQFVGGKEHSPTITAPTKEGGWRSRRTGKELPSQRDPRQVSPWLSIRKAARMVFEVSAHKSIKKA